MKAYNLVVGRLGGKMARLINRLNSKKIDSICHGGYYPDGGGLYLQVKSIHSKSWVFRYSFNKKSYEMGLGSQKFVTLAEARQKRDEFKKLIFAGTNPLIEKNKQRLEAQALLARKMTFDLCAKSYIESQKVAWKNAKHADQWTNTLETYATPVIGKMPVDEITTNMIMKILEPIWTTKTETASRVRGRIELILNWATARGLRSGENPARWRGHLDNLLPKRSLVQKVIHHKAMPYPLLPEFMNSLRSHTDIASQALQFLILTATRTNETLNAQWSEINFEEKVWVIPAERMKAKREHRVPLTEATLTILASIKRVEFIPYIFASPLTKKRISSNALLDKLNALAPNYTVHGFRSSFRDWVSEETQHARDVAEAALAHTLKDKVEAAYRRGDFFQKRLLLMTDWSTHCCSFNKTVSFINAQKKGF